MGTQTHCTENRSDVFYPETQEKKPHHNYQPKILLVDDSVFAQRVAIYFLRNFGYRNITVSDTGKQAIKDFSGEYDLVILDIDLPDLKGTEVCRQMRKKVSDKKIPIVAYSSHEDKLLKQECFNVGMNEYINKSASLHKFRYIIQCALTN